MSVTYQQFIGAFFPFVFPMGFQNIFFDYVGRGRIGHPNKF